MHCIERLVKGDTLSLQRVVIYIYTFSYLFYELVRVISCASKRSGRKGFWKLTTCLTTWANLFSSSLFCCLNKNCMFLLSFHSKNQRKSALAPSSINTFYVSCVCKCAPSRNSRRCLTHRVSLTDYLSLCNASVAFSSFGYNLTGLERPKPLSATLSRNFFLFTRLSIKGRKNGC